jgi:hypothetical protein
MAASPPLDNGIPPDEKWVGMDDQPVDGPGHSNGAGNDGMDRPPEMENGGYPHGHGESDVAPDDKDPSSYREHSEKQPKVLRSSC